jgi:hypothetical protein
MRRLIALMVVLLLVLAGLAAYAGPGPAPNSGDGVPDGSGYETPPGPIGSGDPFGPAPNAGDGISDGSGMDAPHSFT